MYEIHRFVYACTRTLLLQLQGTFRACAKKNIDRNSFHGSDSSEHENISCDFQILRAQGPGPQDSRIREFEISPDPGSGLASAEPRVRKTYVYA